MAVQTLEAKDTGPVWIVVFLVIIILVVMYNLGSFNKQAIKDVVPEKIQQVIAHPVDGLKTASNLFIIKKDEEKRREINIMDIKTGENYETKSGLKFEVLTLGDGVKPTIDSEVNVHYHGTLLDGTVFDSSVVRGETISFPLRGVIVGWQEGLQYMATGSKFKFTIPADLAYGDNSPSPAIPAGATLVFEVELFSVK